jgi:hypothetical protein
MFVMMEEVVDIADFGEILSYKLNQQERKKGGFV